MKRELQVGVVIIISMLIITGSLIYYSSDIWNWFTVTSEIDCPWVHEEAMLARALDSERTDGSAAKALYMTGTLFFKEGKYDEALRDLNASIKLNPHFSCAYGERAKTYLKLGFPELASQDFDKAYDLRNPQDRKLKSKSRFSSTDRYF